MYAIIAQTETGTLHTVGTETTSIASAWDKLHLARLHGPEGLIQSRIHGAVTAVKLLNLVTGRVLRAVEFVAAQLPALKLSDAMLKAFHADDNATIGLPGAPNTLRALESRGLVKRDNCGVAHLTDLGRQYRRV